MCCAWVKGVVWVWCARLKGVALVCCARVRGVLGMRLRTSKDSVVAAIRVRRSLPAGTCGVGRQSGGGQTIKIRDLEGGSQRRLSASIDSCITQLKAQGPARTCNESKEEEGGSQRTCGLKLYPTTVTRSPPDVDPPPGLEDWRDRPGMLLNEPGVYTKSRPLLATPTGPPTGTERGV